MTRRLSFNPFKTIFNDLPGALSSSASKTPVLTLRQKDDVYHYQQVAAKPWLLDRKVLHLASIVDTEYHSRKAFEALVQMTLLSLEGEVDTRATDRPGFGSEIMSKLAIIPQIKIRMIVDFLFWWEDETARLKKLIAERQDLEDLVARGQIRPESGGDVRATLQSLSTRIATIPSQRDPAVEAGLLQAGLQTYGTETADPPAYTR